MEKRPKKESSRKGEVKSKTQKISDHREKTRSDPLRKKGLENFSKKDRRRIMENDEEIQGQLVSIKTHDVEEVKE